MKRVFLIICSLFLIISPVVFSESVDVDYTNQFFAAKTSSGFVYVFIYSDSFVFVNVSGSNISRPVKMFFAIDSVNDVFIADNVFCVRLRNTLYCYGLSELLDEKNDGERLGSGKTLNALTEMIDNIGALYQYGNTIYYTKNGDNRMYSYLGGKNKKDVPIQNIQVTSSQFSNMIVYYPLSAKRNDEYKIFERDVNNKIREYNNAVNQNDSTAIEKLIGGLPKNDQKFDKVFESVKDFYINKIKYDKELFEKYCGLASLVGNKEKIQNTVSGIKIPSVSESAQQNNNIADYYSKKAEYEKVNSNAYLEEQKRTINDEITAMKKDMISKWGDGFDGKQKNIELVFDRNGLKSNFKWTSGMEFRTNANRIKEFEKTLNNLFVNTKFTESYKNYNEYIAVNKFFSDVVDLYNENIASTNYDKKDILKMMDGFGSYLNGLQEKIAIDYKSKYESEITKLTEKNSKLGEVEKDVERTRAGALEKKNMALEKVVNDISNQYRKNEVVDKIKNIDVVLKGYKQDYIDYCLISNEDKRIHGFPVSVSIELSDFNVNRNNKQEEVRFIRPSLYPLINETDDGIFILTSKKTIVAYDITKPIIVRENIPPLTIEIDDGIFYLIRSGKKQYVVTNDGKLLELIIDKNTGKIRKNDTNKGPVTGKDTVLITANDIYILSEKKINGNDLINIMPCNSNEISDICKMTYKKGKFNIGG